MESELRHNLNFFEFSPLLTCLQIFQPSKKLEYVPDKKLEWKEAWKQIWVPDWKEIWLPAWKKIWRPVIINEWFPTPDHHDHHHHHPEPTGWDRTDLTSQSKVLWKRDNSGSVTSAVTELPSNTQQAVEATTSSIKSR